MAKHPRRLMDQLDDVLDDLHLLQKEFHGADSQLRQAVLAVHDALGALGIVAMHFRP